MSSAKLRNACGTSVAALILNVVTAHASVEISSAPTQNMNCSAGVCTPTAKSAVLNVNDLTAMLSSTDITVKSGNSAVTIGIVSPLAWASTHRLTLDANLNVNIKAQVMVEGTAGLTIVTNDGGTGGDLIFYPGGKIDFWDTNSSLIINGNSHVLAGDIHALADGIAANPNGYFALANNYDAGADGTYLGAGIPTYFFGTFEGLGHEISNFSARASRYNYAIGLFSEAAASLRDVSLRNARVQADHNAPRQLIHSVGALVGNSDGTIINASVDGEIIVANNYSVGGLVGISNGTIARSISRTTILAGVGSEAGGLVGLLKNGEILESQAWGSVSAQQHSHVGGLVGYGNGNASSLLIVQSFATGNVSGSGEELCIGGLVGRADYDVSITDSYATGSAMSADARRIGGVFGCANNKSIITSYSTGPVDNAGHGHHGGFIGVAQAPNLGSDFWDIDTSGQTQACGTGQCSNVTGLTDALLKSGLPGGFDPTIWAQSPSINNGYPYLIANRPQ